MRGEEDFEKHKKRLAFESQAWKPGSPALALLKGMETVHDGTRRVDQYLKAMLLGTIEHNAARIEQLGTVRQTKDAEREYRLRVRVARKYQVELELELEREHYD